MAMAEFVHNTWPHNTTGYSPHHLLFGSQPDIKIKGQESDVPAIENQLNQIRKARTNTYQILESQTAEPSKLKFNEGAQVWLNGQNI